MEKEEFAEILLDTKVARLSPTEPFKYASGLLSPIYTHARAIISFPKERKLIADGFAELVEETVRKDGVDLIVGASSSGISLATYLAQRFHLPMAYVRPAAKGHGKGKAVEGIVNKGSKAILVSDVMSTEEDIPHSVRSLKELGCEIKFCVTILSNRLDIIEPFLNKEKIPFASLTTPKTLAEVAYHKHLITKRERTSLLDWINDPNAWAEKREAAIKSRKAEQAKNIADILLKIKAVSINVKEPFRYVSGIYSPIYTDNRVLISYPDEWSKVIGACADIIVEEIGLQNVDVIAGTATAGIPHAAYLAEKLGKPMVYVKGVKQEDGTKAYEVEGIVPRGAKVLLMEDLISTGGSVLGSVDAVREAGGIVNDIIAIFTYQMEKSMDNFNEKEVVAYSLSDIKTLLDVAAGNGYIQPDEKSAVIEWTKDTKGWGKKKGFE